MKKVLISIALLIWGLIATAQIDTTGMSDYEKYYYAKEKQSTAVPITHYNPDSLASVKTEFDDLYYKPSEDKQVTTIFDRKPKQPKLEGYYDGYSDGYEEGVEDVARLFDDDFSYANRFYRFNYGYGFSYYSPYWRFHYGYYDPFWYDPFYSPFRWDPWYYDNYYYSPYYSYNWYSPYRYDYWYGYNSYPYAHTYVYVDNRTPNRGYGIMGSRSYSYHSPNKNIANSRSIYQKYPTTSAKSSIMNMNTARRTSPSTFSGTKSAFTQDTRTTAKQVPTIINRTNAQTRRVETTPATKSTQAYQKPTYNSSQRTYTPSYNQPSRSTRPQYNNTNPQKMQTDTYRMNQPATVKTPSQTRTTTQTQNRTYSAPTQQRTTTQTRTYSAPRTSAPTYSAPSKSTYSTPSRSSGSSYSTPSRSSSSSYSTPSRSSGSSYSGGSSSGSRSTSSSSSSGSMGKRR